MADGIKTIIKQLERQAQAIERALAALRDVEGIETPDTATSAQGSPAKRPGRGTKTFNRRAEGQRKRWAAKKASQQAEAGESPENAPATRKGGLTAEGRKRLALAMKRRWAAKRAGSQAPKKRGPRKKTE